VLFQVREKEREYFRVDDFVNVLAFLTAVSSEPV
jgi:hypothetical protein